MEHILQFGINIDDETIKKNILKNAEEQVIKDISYDVKAALFEKSYYGRNDFTKTPTMFLTKKLDDFLAENKDEILELVTDKLAEKLSKTKKAKETLDVVLKEI